MPIDMRKDTIRQACIFILGAEVAESMERSFPMPVVMACAANKAFAYSMQGPEVETLRDAYRGLNYEGLYIQKE